MFPLEEEILFLSIRDNHCLRKENSVLSEVETWYLLVLMYANRSKFLIGCSSSSACASWGEAFHLVLGVLNLVVFSVWKGNLSSLIFQWTYFSLFHPKLFYNGSICRHVLPVVATNYKVRLKFSIVKAMPATSFMLQEVMNNGNWEQSNSGGSQARKLHNLP